jgi:antibiotic biosynthesis monooxygenase (ABM) superfamily enzyme
MKDAKYFLVVKFSIDPQAEAQVLRWLDGGHAAEVAKQPGFLWCKRLRLDGQGAYLMMYGIDSKDAFLAYENNAALKKKFVAERASFEKFMRIERYHGPVELSV